MFYESVISIVCNLKKIINQLLTVPTWWSKKYKIYDDTENIAITLFRNGRLDETAQSQFLFAHVMSNMLLFFCFYERLAYVCGVVRLNLYWEKSILC